MWRLSSTVLVFGLCIATLLAIYGCREFESQHRAPVEPGVATQIANYWASETSGKQVGVYVNEHGSAFSLQVPAGGPYRLTYTVSSDGGDKDVRSYHIVFRALFHVVLCVGLMPNDLLTQARLETGTVTAPALHSDGTIELFAWPDGWVGWDTDAHHPTDVWLSDITNIQLLIQDGVLVEGVVIIDNQCKTTPTLPEVPTATPVSSSPPSCVNNGSANFGESKILRANSAGCLEIQEYCVEYICNSGSAPITFDFIGGVRPGSKELLPGSCTFNSGADFSPTVTCPIGWDMVSCPALGGTVALHEYGFWRVNGTTCTTNFSTQCGTHVSNSSSIPITVTFTGGNNPGTKVIAPGGSARTQGATAAACPVSWTLVP